MSIYAIADLHLSFSTNKPMDIFGNNWENHSDKIKENWIKTVREEDTVILPGDLSWGMNFEEAKPDFEFLNSLPGKKILLKGNHDYWWGTANKINQFLEENNFNNIHILYNNSYLIEDKLICGTRGWTIINNTEEDEKVFKREILRLEASLKDGVDKYGTNKEMIVCMHYPPTNDIMKEESEFIQVMRKYNVKKCIYGHLHGESHKEAVQGKISEILVQLVSCDYTNFELIKL